MPFRTSWSVGSSTLVPSSSAALSRRWLRRKSSDFRNYTSSRVNFKSSLLGWAIEWCWVWWAKSFCTRSSFVQVFGFLSILLSTTFLTSIRLFQLNCLLTHSELFVLLSFYVTFSGPRQGSHCFEYCLLWNGTNGSAGGFLALIKIVPSFLVCPLLSIIERVSSFFFLVMLLGEWIEFGMSIINPKQEWQSPHCRWGRLLPTAPTAQMEVPRQRILLSKQNLCDAGLSPVNILDKFF